MLSLHILLAIPFQLQLVGLSVFAFLIWYFVLRKYRNLGLRMFFLFSLVATLTCYWLYCDIQDEKSMIRNGQFLTAKVLGKTKIQGETSSSVDNLITILFQFPEGKSQTVSTATYVSNDEFAALAIGQRINVLYNPVNGQTYYTVSFNRYKKEQWILYNLPVFFLIVGLIFGIIFRKYEIGVHEDVGDEYVEKDGKIILDEKRSTVARAMKQVSILSNFFSSP